MNFECTRKELLSAVENVARIASPTATLPVLRCLVLEASSESVLLKATNLEISVERTFPAQVKKEGVVAIPAQVLHATLKNTTRQEKVVVSVEDNVATLVIGEAKTTINTVSVDDFPTIPHITEKESYALPREAILRGFKSVLYAASTSLIKPELASVYMYYEDRHLVFVATDSFRLAEKKVALATDIDIPALIIPVKNAIEIQRILDSLTQEEVSVTVDENQMEIRQGDILVSVRIIDGSFPDYRSILPKEVGSEVVVLKEDLLTVLRKAQIFSDKFGQITFHILKNEKKITISARNSDIGETYDSLDAVVEGNDLDISFNHRYVVDMFQSLTTDSIKMTFAGAGRPLVVRGVSDQTFTYLVMPMNR